MDVASGQARRIGSQTFGSMAIWSRDGRWLAFYTDETGGNRLYVQPYPSGGTRTLVPGSASQSGISSGCWWSRDGREILFDMGDGSVRAAAVESGETFHSGRARVLFEFGDNLISKCPMPDHEQFLAIVRSGETPVSAIVTDLQWPAALRRR
jgi:hypothetical protein